MRVLICLFIGFAVAAALPSDPQRIIGGSVTTINQYPAIAVLLKLISNSFRQTCGGSILNNRAILTAAHCMDRDTANMWRIRVGSTWASSGGVVHNTQTIRIHPSYNMWTSENDIAVMHSASTFTFINNAVQPARIAGSNYNLADNQVVWAAGWGVTSNGGQPSEQLRHVQIWSINQATCRNRYGAVNVPITDNMLCSGWLDVGGRDQCQQDSGGPLYHNGVVVGVCSFGMQCGDPHFPGVNARVSRYASWIQSNA